MTNFKKIPVGHRVHWLEGVTRRGLSRPKSLLPPLGADHAPLPAQRTVLFHSVSLLPVWLGWLQFNTGRPRLQARSSASGGVPRPPQGKAFHPQGGRCPRRGRMRGWKGTLSFTIRGDNLAAPSSVIRFADATFPLEGGRLLGAFPSILHISQQNLSYLLLSPAQSIIMSYQKRGLRKSPHVRLFRTNFDG